MKYLIACLGNVGSEYAGTRHNVGFEVGESLLKNLSEKAPISFENSRYADVATPKFRGKTLVIIKPSTFMNLSGHAVSYWMQKEKIGVESLLVVADDLALPFGTLRLKPKGSDGGHNGLRHIAEILGTNDYPRLRFGIGSAFSRGKQVDYVLGKWNEEEIKGLPPLLERSVAIVKSFVSAGMELTMTSYNK